MKPSGLEFYEMVCGSWCGHSTASSHRVVLGFIIIAFCFANGQTSSTEYTENTSEGFITVGIPAVVDSFSRAWGFVRGGL